MKIQKWFLGALVLGLGANLCGVFYVWRIIGGQASQRAEIRSVLCSLMEEISRLDSLGSEQDKQKNEFNVIREKFAQEIRRMGELEAKQEQQGNLLSRIQDDFKSGTERFERICSDLSAGYDAIAEKRAQEYLRAAREAKEQDIKLNLYQSALRFSRIKTPLMMELITWRAKSIEEALSSSPAEAREQLEHLVRICDEQFVDADPSDMSSVSEIRKSLQNITRRIDAVVGSHTEKIRGELNKMRETLELSNDKDTIRKLDENLSKLDVPDELENMQNSIESLIQMKLSYLTEHNETLIIPEICDQTPWVSWLEHFAERLSSSQNPENLVDDIEIAADFLGEARKQKNNERIQEEVSKIERLSRNVYAKCWCQRTQALLSEIGDSAPNPEQLARVFGQISESQDIAPDYRSLDVIQCLGRLHAHVISNTRKTLLKNYNTIEALSQKVGDDVCLHMYSSLLSQYILLVSSIYDLSAEYPNSVDYYDELEKIRGISQIIDGYQKRMKCAMVACNDSKRTDFINRVKERLRMSKKEDEAGENIANDWLSTRDNENAVKHYRKAWFLLAEIHEDDLRAADPLLFRAWLKQKNDVENHWKPSEGDLMSVKYIRIEDF